MVNSLLAFSQYAYVTTLFNMINSFSNNYVLLNCKSVYARPQYNRCSFDQFSGVQLKNARMY